MTEAQRQQLVKDLRFLSEMPGMGACMAGADEIESLWEQLVFDRKHLYDLGVKIGEMADQMQTMSDRRVQGLNLTRE